MIALILAVTLQWNMPTTHEGWSPRGQRCLAGADLTTDSLWAFVTRQPLVGVPVCVARLRCARGAYMRWTVPDSLRGAWFDVVASTGWAHSCSGNVVYVAEAPGFRMWWFGQ